MNKPTAEQARQVLKMLDEHAMWCVNSPDSCVECAAQRVLAGQAGELEHLRGEYEAMQIERDEARSRVALLHAALHQQLRQLRPLVAAADQLIADLPATSEPAYPPVPPAAATTTATTRSEACAKSSPATDA